MLIMTIVLVICCLLFTVIGLAAAKKDPLSDLHNMPIALQEKVAAMPQYEGVEVVRTKERIIKKLPAMICFAVVFVLLAERAGAKTFWQGFGYTFYVWAGTKLYVTFVLNCLVYAHMPSLWIPGTEDCPSYYQDYRFYLSSIPRSFLVGAVISVLVGVGVTLI